ncbi:MAG: Holliday junction resolvase RuvX [Thermotogae bacterium]|nr:Holliday junction resolvase RuvX [Thermotogota bacterium]
MGKVLLGIDYGRKRSGIAELNTDIGFVKPLGAFKTNELIRFLLERSNRFDDIVVGLPLNLKGKFSEITFKSVAFAEKLHKILKKRIFLIDERLSSNQSEWLFKQSMSNKRFKDVKDKFAASLILESFFQNPSMAFEINMNFDRFPEKLIEEILGKNVLVSNKKYKLENWIEKPERLLFQTKDPYYFYVLSKMNLKALFCDFDEIPKKLIDEFDIII